MVFASKPGVASSNLYELFRSISRFSHRRRATLTQRRVRLGLWDCAARANPYRATRGTCFVLFIFLLQAVFRFSRGVFRVYTNCAGRFLVTLMSSTNYFTTSFSSLPFREACAYFSNVEEGRRSRHFIHGL